MLTNEDYNSLKAGVKGWTARKLAKYGVSWPPIAGWRTRLLREYESAHSPRISVGRSTYRVPLEEFYHRKPNDLEVKLNRLLNSERNLTSLWYLRISGQVEWEPEEKEKMEEQFAFLSEKIKILQSDQAAEDVEYTRGGFDGI